MKAPEDRTQYLDLRQARQLAESVIMGEVELNKAQRKALGERLRFLRAREKEEDDWYDEHTFP